jgi:hypothetical protein
VDEATSKPTRVKLWEKFGDFGFLSGFRGIIIIMSMGSANSGQFGLRRRKLAGWAKFG